MSKKKLLPWNTGVDFHNWFTSRVETGRSKKGMPSGLQFLWIREPSVQSAVMRIGWWTLFKITHFPKIRRKFFYNLNKKDYNTWNHMIDDLITVGFFKSEELERSPGCTGKETPKFTIILGDKGKKPPQ